MLKNTDIITNTKSNEILVIILHLAYNQQRGLNYYSLHLYYHFRFFSKWYSYWSLTVHLRFSIPTADVIPQSKFLACWYRNWLLPPSVLSPTPGYPSTKPEEGIVRYMDYYQYDFWYNILYNGPISKKNLVELLLWIEILTQIGTCKKCLVWETFSIHGSISITICSTIIYRVSSKSII